MLLAVCISERYQLSQQEGVLEHPLHGFDQIRLQGGGVLLGVVPCIQELFEGLVCLCFKKEGMSVHQMLKLFISGQMQRRSPLLQHRVLQASPLATNAPFSSEGDLSAALCKKLQKKSSVNDTEL